MSSQDNDDVIDLPAPISDDLAEEDAPFPADVTSSSSTTLTPLGSVSRSQPTSVSGSQPSVLSPTTTATGELPILTTSTTTLSDSSLSPSYLPIPLTAPPGSIVMTQPVVSAGADIPLYKIARGAPVTFGWKFYNVLATPTYLTVAAIAGGRTYAVGGTGALPDNLILGTKAGDPGVVAGTATQVVWDLDAYQSANPDAQLLQTMYTLSIWDDRGPLPTFRPGYMLPNAQLKFSLYTPQAYQSLDDGKLFSLPASLVSSVVLCSCWSSAILRIHLPPRQVWLLSLLFDASSRVRIRVLCALSFMRIETLSTAISSPTTALRRKL